MNKRIIAFIIVIVAIASVMCACGARTTVEADGHAVFRDAPKNEWVSPDGVHYWVYGHQLAPRYNRNGVLVIE